jgi:recombination protein RecR
MITPSLDDLILHFGRLPGIGKKTAQRLAFHVLKSDRNFSESFARSLKEVKEKTIFCNRCGNISEQESCNICSDVKRDDQIICVVSDFMDIVAIEKTNEFRGKYHVLGGVLSPLDGIGPNDLNIDSLTDRINNGEIKELILALTPTTEGEATLTYLTYLYEEKDVTLTRIARGVPMGTQLEFIDQATLGRAISGRGSVES